MSNLCKNAFAGESAWYCYDFGGRKTKGKETLDASGRCEACKISTPPFEEAPSFMSGNED